MSRNKNELFQLSQGPTHCTSPETDLRECWEMIFSKQDFYSLSKAKIRHQQDEMHVCVSDEDFFFQCMSGMLRNRASEGRVLE